VLFLLPDFITGKKGWIEFEFDSAQKFLMNLNFRSLSTMNLNFGFSKALNLNFGFSKTMTLNLNVKFKNFLNFPNQVVIL